jgi:hypothetical protein
MFSMPRGSGAESEGSSVMSKKTFLKRVSAGVLDVAYYESGPADGVPTRFLSPDTPRSGEQAKVPRLRVRSRA